MAHVVGELQDYLQHECGEGEALPDNVFHDVMLQVHVHTFPLGTLITNPFLILFKPESALFNCFNIPFSFSGNQADSDRHQAAGGGQLAPVRGLDLPPLCHGWRRHVLPLGDVFRAVRAYRGGRTGAWPV